MLNKMLMIKNQSPINIIKGLYFHLDSKRKIEIFILLFLSIFSSLAEIISIAIIIPFISVFINPNSYLLNDSFKFFLDIFNINDSVDLLGTISLMFILIVILSALIKIKFVSVSNKFSQNISSDFRIKIFEFFIKQNYSYFTKHGSNDIMTTLLSKSKYNSVVALHSINILNSILISFAIFGAIIYVDPINTGIIVLSTILFFYIIFKFQAKKVFQMGDEINTKLYFMLDIFTNAVGYLPEIIVYSLRNIYSKIFKKTSKRIAELQADTASIAMYAKFYFEAFIIIFVIILVYYSNLSSKSLEENISYFAVLAFAAQKCLPLINGVYKSSINFKSSIPMVSDTLRILNDTEFNIKSLDNIVENKKNITFKKKIKIDKIKFQYNKDLPFILNNVDFQINKGDKIAVKGKTGTGKSTLINIILGLINPTEGKIIVDDIEITENNQISWQKNISIVPQNIFLNDATISENIAIAEDPKTINLDRVKQCAEIAQVANFIEGLKNKYEEMTGERGVKLSGGQRQRIGIARSLYRNANLIILDEPTNALDEVTEKKVMHSIMNLDTTIIMISHSDTSLEYFDKVIDLNDFK